MLPLSTIHRTAVKIFLPCRLLHQDGANDMQLFWSIILYGGRDGDVDVLQKHINLYEAGDARKALFYLGCNCHLP